MGNLNFSRFGTRGVAKVQNWDSRSCFAGIGNRVLTQRGALILNLLLIFTNDFEVFCWRGDFLRFGLLFWKSVVFYSVFAFWRAPRTEIRRLFQCFRVLERHNS